jgi:hypothetical protein
MPSEPRPIWERPVRTWDDLIVRAAIAVHWFSPYEFDNPVNPEHTIAIEDTYPEEALAHVVKSILDMSGLKLDRDGRYIGPEGAKQADMRTVPTVGSWID